MENFARSCSKVSSTVSLYPNNVADGNSFELKFIAPEKLLDAVIYTDVVHIDAAIDAEEGEWYRDHTHLYLTNHLE